MLEFYKVLSGDVVVMDECESEGTSRAGADRRDARLGPAADGVSPDDAVGAGRHQAERRVAEPERWLAEYHAKLRNNRKAS